MGCSRATVAAQLGQCRHGVQMATGRTHAKQRGGTAVVLIVSVRQPVTRPAEHMLHRMPPPSCLDAAASRAGWGL